MASVVTLKTKGKPNGRRAVQFRLPDSRPEERGTVRLGKVSQEAAEEFGRCVDELVNAKNAGQQARKKVLDWLSELSDELADRLAQFEVIPARHKAPTAVLKQFLDDYVTKRTDVKGSTAIVYGHTRRCLVEYFEADRPLDEITAGDCDEWRLWLADKQKLADNTVRRRCAIAKQFFRAAVRKRLIPENPFDGMKGCVVRENRQRDYFVTVAEAAAVLDACPDAQWRLLFALSRFGGLRCPSEHLALTWGDVDLPGGKMVVRSPKTEHHEGKGSRVVPIFPELHPYLEAVWDQAEPGTNHVITRYRDATQNLRTTLTKIIKRAGLEPWPKLWQNLRSTRETELCESFPIHVVCNWIGNSQAVAKKHYLQVTDEHFTKATAGDGIALKKALQNSMQGQARWSQIEAEQKNENPGKRELSEVYTAVQVGDEGLEPPTSCV